MPNGGSDCCVSCWFNEINAGKRETSGAKVPTSCTIRGFPIEDPWHTYCANHVRRERMVCKFWIEPVALAQNHGFSAQELNQIRIAVQANLQKIQEAWREHCG